MFKLSRSAPLPPGPTLDEIEEAIKKGESFFTLDCPLHFTKKYGEFFRIPTLKRFYCITGKEGFEHILKTKSSDYSKNNLYYTRMKALFGKSLLVTEGSYWKNRRKISQPAFQPSMIKNYVPAFIECSQSFIAELSGNSKLPGNPNPSKPMNVLTLMNHLTLNIAFKIFCGNAVSNSILKSVSRCTYFGNWYVSHAFFISPFKPTFNNLRFYYLAYRLNRHLLKIIRDRREILGFNGTEASENQVDKTYQEKQEQQENQDLLDRLLFAKNEDNTRPLTDKEILAEFKTLLLTGHETTAAGLTWMWYLLASYPKYREELEAELEAVLGGRPPEMEDLPNLPLLRAIVLETFRLYPPIWSLARSSLQEDTIYGFPISKKSLIILHIYALHRNPNYWEHPNEFYPPRFLGEAFKKIPSFAYLPFGFGQRICIANNLGVIESMIVAGTIAQKMRFEKTKKTKAVPEPCISLRPKGGIWMNAIFRKPA